jgi:hypothetical protein
MTQTLYAHMNKKKFFLIKKKALIRKFWLSRLCLKVFSRANNLESVQIKKELMAEY